MISEQELARIAKRHKAGTTAADKRKAQLNAERDEAIRAAAGTVTRRRIAQIFGLSHQRVDQIIRGARL